MIYTLAYAEPVKQDSARAVRAQALLNFYSFNPDARIEINPVTGVPEDIWGDISRYQNQSDPVEAAYEFFEQNKELYGIGNPRKELQLQGKAIDQYGGMADFKQLYKGVEVYQSSLRAYFTPSGKLKGIMGGFAQVGDISTYSHIDSNAAIGIAKRDLNYTAEEEEKVAALETFRSRGRRPVNAWLFVAPFKERYHLVWIVGLRRELPTDVEQWEYWLDAHSGLILQKKETLSGIHSGRDRKTRVQKIQPAVEKESKASEPKLRESPEDSSVTSKKAPR